MGADKHVALYRRYRSRDFDDVVGQTHVTDTLASAVKAGRVVHAYLFTGPHGVGKTSVARILAHSVNKLNYKPDSQHLDIIEIDAASNRGIDEVRELREKALLTPSSAKYKVYIIDEVHMLTPPAFNALLKLLEEPPAHAIFILATTEVHKVPATIRSRTQWYGFRPIEPAQIAKRLKQIADKEEFKVTQSALELIAVQGGGSLRDSIGLLDQLSTESGTIDNVQVIKLLGLVPGQTLSAIIEAVDKGQLDSVREQLKNARDNGFAPKQLASQLISQLQDQPTNAKRLDLIERLISVGAAHESQLALEVALLRATLADAEPASKAELSAAEDTQAPSMELSSDLAAQHWSNILADIKHRNNSLYAILRLAEPTLEDDTLKLNFNFIFHKQRLDEDRNRQAVAEAASQRLGRPVNVTSQISSNAQRAEIKPVEPALDEVLKVMGGGELSSYEDEL